MRPSVMRNCNGGGAARSEARAGNDADAASRATASSIAERRRSEETRPCNRLIGTAASAIVRPIVFKRIRLSCGCSHKLATLERSGRAGNAALHEGDNLSRLL